MITVRHELPADAARIRHIHKQAFATSDEADLVDSLRERDMVTLSLVALNEVGVVGHILFSPADVVSDGMTRPAVALGPVAVLPDLQRTGIGSRLIKHAILELRHAAHGLIVVVGHPKYYRRFGFLPASSFGVRCELDVDDEAFMLLELQRSIWKGGVATVRFQREFSEV